MLSFLGCTPYLNYIHRTGKSMSYNNIIMQNTLRLKIEIHPNCKVYIMSRNTSELNNVHMQNT